MSLLEFCLEVLKRESSKFNPFFDVASVRQLTTASDVSFDIAHNRCAYLYKCGTISLTFAMDCYRKFLSDHKGFILLLSKYAKRSELAVCSLSKGPAFDYIAFILACQIECDNIPSLFNNVKVISKYGAWRNTVNFMLDILKGGYFQSILSIPWVANIEVIQGDPFDNFTDKIKQPINEADIVLMVKTLNLQADGSNQNKIIESLREFLNILKPGAIIFCIDTKPSVSLITQEFAPFGNFLYQPTHITTQINSEFLEISKLNEQFGCIPIISSRGSFFVWEKSLLATLNEESLMDEVSESVTHLLNIKSSCDYYSMPLTVIKDGEEKLTNDIPPASSNSIQKELKLLEKVVENSIANISCESVSSNSLQNLSENYNPTKNDLFKDCASADVFVQAESRDSLQGNASKIVELTNRIAQLTRTLSDILKTRESNVHKNSRGSEIECEHTILNSCISNQSLSLPMHRCQGKDNLCCVHGQCTGTKCCPINPYHHGYCTPNHYSSNNSKHCCLCDNKLKISSENDSNVAPKLIIPLNNLSEDVVSKILSLLSQASEK